MEEENGRTIPPLPMAENLPHHTAGAPPQSQGHGARAQTVVWQTGITASLQGADIVGAGPSSAPQSGFSCPVNQGHGVSADDHVGLLLNRTDSTLNPVYMSFRRADQLDSRTVLDKCRVPFYHKNEHKCEPRAKSATLKRFVEKDDLWSVKTVGVGSQTRHVLVTINVPVFTEVTGRQETLLQGAVNTYLQEPNLCVVQTCCKACIHIDANDHQCTECGVDKTRIFKDQQSHVAEQWLCWETHQRGVSILRTGNGREEYVLGQRVDGAVKGTCQHNDKKDRWLTGVWVIDEIRKAVEKGYTVEAVHEVWECGEDHEPELEYRQIKQLYKWPVREQGLKKLLTHVV
uniref:(California timema) hypothetical protein n=1 Tax=Timema californicum TaxID=61474 RepID=A0A7R9P8J3_TIMCA|nr:unnamed protein product [Timema californicum]